jgi:hypothetical protein
MEVVSDEPDAPPGPRAADLNWAAIHALVQEIPKTFRDPSFSNSGHQISRVVTASDPARELEQVKAWQTSLEGIVDELVGTHHGSLSRSIKNYAKIVHLFEVNRANVDTTRAVLNEGRARLVSDARRDEKVVSAWRRALVGREVARKLADLERMTRVPGTARACVAAGDFETAVALINQSNAELSAPTLETIQTALADVRRECAATEAYAREKIIREIGRIVFCCDAPCRRDAARVRASADGDVSNEALFEESARVNVSSSRKPNARNDAESSPMPFATTAEKDKNARDAIARLVECAARLGAPGLDRALEGLRLCVSREIWTLIAEQIAYCATRADDLEAAARRANEASEATREAESEDIREDANLAANLVFADDAGTDGVFQTPARCLVAATDILAKHLCALVRSVLANLSALDLELKTRTSFTRDGVSETERAKEASFAARARETLRLALPPALDGLGRTPRLCEGLEGLVGADGAKKNAARDAGAWWHGGRTTFAECTPERRSESESRNERFPVKRFSASDQRRASEPPFASKARSRLVSFGPDGNRSAETRDEGSERFARAAAAAVRLARARLGGPGSTTRVFELECVKETFALFELESDAARA